MTIATDAGFVVGQRYLVINDGTAFDECDIVTFVEDDETYMPVFRSEEGHDGYAHLSDVRPVADDYDYDYYGDECDCQQPLQFDMDSNAEDGTTISFHKQLTAGQISAILTIAENN